MQQFSVVNLLADYKFPSRKTHFMFGTGIKTVEGGGSLYRNDSSLLYALTCVYVYNFLEACSSRNHVSHSWRSNASIGFSCGKPSIYVLRSSVLSICQQPGVFSLPLPSCLAPSLSCSSSQLSVSFFFFIRSFVQAFSLSLFFFYDLSTFSSFSFLSNYLSLLDLFPSHRSYFRVRFLPLFSLSYSSFFVCFRSLSFFCTSSSIFYSLFLWLQERGTEASVLPFDIFKKFFSYQFSISFFFSIALYALHLTLYLFDFFL